MVFYSLACYVPRKYSKLRSAVIHLEIGSSESRDSHSQKPVSPSDKRMSPILHFSPFSVPRGSHSINIEEKTQKSLSFCKYLQSGESFRISIRIVLMC